MHVCVCTNIPTSNLLALCLTCVCVFRLNNQLECSSWGIPHNLLLTNVFYVFIANEFVLILCQERRGNLFNRSRYSIGGGSLNISAVLFLNYIIRC